MSCGEGPAPSWIISGDLTWARCLQGTVFEDGQCLGEPIRYQYCATQDHSCDDGTTLHGIGSSEVWETCNHLELGELTWRVPTGDELGALLRSYNYQDEFLYPDKQPGRFQWSSSANVEIPTLAWTYWSGYEQEDIQALTPETPVKWGGSQKTIQHLVRCVSDDIPGI